MRRTLGWMMVAVLGGLPVATACGSDSGLSKKEFIARGDAICKRLSDRSDKVAEPTDEKGIDDYLGKVLDLADQARADLAELDPPKDGESVQDALLASLDGTIDKARDAQAAAAKGDMDAVQKALEDAGKAAVKADKAARSYGFNECADEG